LARLGTKKEAIFYYALTWKVVTHIKVPTFWHRLFHYGKAFVIKW
jgi:hypothetical protein